MPNPAQWRRFILQDAPKYGIDPKAALAVASMEGLSGRVGDGGHAFGPFQMNDAGGVLTGRPGNHRAYAESRVGINDALRNMARTGAAGLTGVRAINAIVRNYERPKAPNPEVAGAIAQYGKTGSGTKFAQSFTGSGTGARGNTIGPSSQSLFTEYFLNKAQQDATGQPNPGALLSLVIARNALSQGTGSSLSPSQGKQSQPPTRLAKGGIRELFYDPLGGIKNGQQIGAIGHHTDHVHVALSTRQAQESALQLAKQMGLRVGEESDRDVHPVHVSTSYHYREFGGGLRQAADISGDPNAMAAYYKRIAANYGGK